MDYSNSNITLSDSLSGYITANEDECDNTRYLSVLSQDLTLQDMNVTLSNEQIEEHNGTDLVTAEEMNQPIIFTVDGTDEIYGVQVAQDEDGNLQKFQVQYSKNMNGDLVPMLETIQMLPLDYEEQVISSEENCSPSVVSQSNDNFIITNEEFIPHGSKTDLNLKNDIGFEDQEYLNRNIQELNISTTTVTSVQASMKEEPEELFERCSTLETDNENIVETQNSIEFASINPKEEEISNNVLVMEDGANDIQHLEIQHCLEQEELYEETIEEKHFEQLFLEENHIIDNNQLIRDDTALGNDQQNEFYHILNRGDANPETEYDQSMHAILKETVDQHPKSNILKKPVQKSLLKDFMNSEQKIVYVLPEKENLTVMDVESFTKPNSRSVLKCNQPSQVLKQSDHLYVSEIPLRNIYTKALSRTKETKPIQTYLRTKEAKEARQFMNFINSTTITQVPERKGRLPRKQQIKPVKHPDEDIVVKEMIVSSNGFVEPISAEERKYLPVTEYVELIDSGDEMCNKKKRKGNEAEEMIEIEISDTDESDVGVVDLESIPKDELENEAKNGMKKKRGRPPKGKSLVHEKKDAYPNSPPKISRLDNDVESVTSTLQVIRMENDVKNVENTLETERNTAKTFSIDKIEENIAKNESSKRISTNAQQNLNKEKPSQSQAKSKVSSSANGVTSRKEFEYKYECEKCRMKFINKFLQSRHNCVSKVGAALSCNICQQKFTTTTNLNLHKKIHVKEAAMIKPNLTKISHIKENSKKDTVSSGSLVKSSLSSAKNSVVISKAPPKIPSRQSVLPSKNPRPSFLSVKNARGSVLPVKGKQLVVPSMQLPKNCTLPIKNKNSEDTVENSNKLGNGSIKIEDKTLKSLSIDVTPEKPSNSSIFKCEKQCNKCSMSFENHSLWFDHQVLKHGLKTPDKSIGEKKLKKIVKDKVVHNGLRTAPTVARNFSMLKNMVQDI